MGTPPSELSLRILVVEDEPAHAEAIRRAFDLEGFADVSVAQTLGEYRKLVATAPPDIAILDLNLPDGRAIEILTSPPSGTTFPVLVMTSFGSEQMAVEAMRAGALDYIVKSAEAFAAMPQTVARALREWRLVHARRQDHARIAHLNSVLRGMRAVSQLITQSHDEGQLPQLACEYLVQTMGYHVVWIALQAEEGGLRLSGQAGLGPELGAHLASILERGRLPSCAQLALATAGVHPFTGPREECVGCTLSESSPHCGALACRMEHDGHTYGVMVGCMADEFVSDPEEQSLFQGLVRDIAFALYRFGRERQHRASETALARSEVRYRDLVANLEDVVFSVSAEGRIEYMSQAIERVYGFAPEEMVGRHFSEFVHPEDLPALNGHLARTLAGEVSTYEFRANDKWGRPRYLRATNRRRLENDRVAGVDGVIVDFTKLRQAQDAKAELEATLETAFLANPAAVCIGDFEDNGRLIAMSETFERITGYDRSELVGKTSAEVGFYEDPRVRVELHRGLHDKGRVRDLEFRLRRKNGEVREGLMNAVLSHVGQRRLLIAVILDITERQREQLDLQRRLRFETLMALLAARFLDVRDEELDDALVQALEQICDCYDLDRASLWQPEAGSDAPLVLTHSCLRRDGPQEKPGTVAKEILPWTLAQLRASRKTLSLTDVSLLPPAADRDRQTYANLGITNALSIPWCGAGEELLGVIDFSSMRGQAPDEVAIRQIETLAQTILLAVLSRARERRAADSGRKERQELQQQLAHAQKMEAVGRLAGGVAHDFNNLLSVILSYASFAMDSLREGDPLRGDLEQIKNAGQRAAVVTRQLLAFSRKQRLEPEILDVNQVVSGLEKMLRRLLGEDIEIDIRLAEALGRVKADPGQLQQLIMNLVVNARDAMPQGGRLIIETENVVNTEPDPIAPESGGGHRGYVMLKVADTGCGMGPETRDRIFEPFFTTKEPGKGTGLGLATVYGIVKQSGGDISVDSRLGHGTTFRIYLPRARGIARTQTHRALPAIAAGHETILLVEDEAQVRAIAERTLQMAGYRVLAAASAGDALVLWEKHEGKFDLLLTDVVMPHMGGPDLAQRLIKVAPGLKVLYMSGYTDEALLHHGGLVASTRLLAKPFVPGDLLRAVRDALGDEDKGAASTPASADNQMMRDAESRETHLPEHPRE